MVLLVAGLSFYLVSAVAFTVGYFATNGVGGANRPDAPDALKQVVQSRLWMTVTFVVPQLFLALPPLFAAALSRRGLAVRLGLVRGHWPAWGWLSAALATPLVGLASTLLVGLFMEESEQLKMLSEVLRDHGRSGFLLPLIVIIGVVPAVCEELLFRGYVQTRLTRRIGAVGGVLIASLIFALVHLLTGGWVHVVAVFPIGLWMGWLALRSGSIYPAMIAHLINNALSVVAMVVDPSEQPDALALPIMTVTLAILFSGIVGVAGVAAASRYRPPERGFAGDAGPFGEAVG